MYRYRGLTSAEKTETLQQKQLNRFPPHARPTYTLSKVGF